MTKLTVAFRNFSKAPKNVNSVKLDLKTRFQMGIKATYDSIKSNKIKGNKIPLH
jgi:hypothetical protein